MSHSKDSLVQLRKTASVGHAGQHPYRDFLEKVEKPARYLGGEYMQVKKAAADVDLRMVLAFPDIYDIGMSHLGTKILYTLLNQHEKIAAERAFAPWPDLEAELRKRNLPLVTLESAEPLSAFDVVGFSLQYELTYTNILNMLDLGGIPIRQADRKEGDPLVIAGGPVATHPEPLSDFVDAFFIGEAEEVLSSHLLMDAAARKAGVPRRERLIRLAEAGGFYVPSLYNTELDEVTGLLIPTTPQDARVPARVRRQIVEDINKFPFPSNFPVPYAEAVFDRVAVEIARGCTEGCRFCQAGMIYRPVRERDPEAIVDAVLKGVENGGYDETSLTALSTADVSCITPLVRRVMGELRPRKVSLSVSSLRAYGLSEELLDEMTTVRATGLTFAPEAGTQRMRDVICKNVTEEHITESAERAFSRGYGRMKCYFMIGLPTETDEDVAGIVQTGGRLRRVGLKYDRRAQITVSVSTHVPKPHTPFQWCAMDGLPEIQRKQRLLRELAQGERVELKWHEGGQSVIEGIFARGDRRVGAALELAWQRGARFDGWDEHFDFATWKQTFTDIGLEVAPYLGTLPVDARLPWDVLDMRLEEGFLAKEYRKALKGRLSPPCGKPFGKLLHPSSVEEALETSKKLVCYDCGVACDLTEMREERLVFLRKLGAEQKVVPEAGPRPSRPTNVPRASFTQGEGRRLRIRYAKVGALAYVGHLDLIRHLSRVFRRAGVELIYTKGFHPKPQMVFGPALGLGIATVAELVDVQVETELDLPALAARLQAAAPEGLRLEDMRFVALGEQGLPKRIGRGDYIAVLRDGDAEAISRRLGEVASLPELLLERERTSSRKETISVDVLPALRSATLLEVTEGSTRDPLYGLDVGPGVRVRFSIDIKPDGSIKPREVLKALVGEERPAGAMLVRVALVDKSGHDAYTPVPVPGLHVSDAPFA